MISPRSRGKGSRRTPGRDGGRKRAKKVAPWRKRAQHAVASRSDLADPIASLAIHGWYGDLAEETIYKFDQAMADAGLPYYAECTGGRHVWTFNIWVASDKALAVHAIIARIKRT